MMAAELLIETVEAALPLALGGPHEPRLRAIAGEAMKLARPVERYRPSTGDRDRSGDDLG